MLVRAKVSGTSSVSGTGIIDKMGSNKIGVGSAVMLISESKHSLERVDRETKTQWVLGKLRFRKHDLVGIGKETNKSRIVAISLEDCINYTRRVRNTKSARVCASLITDIVRALIDRDNDTSQIFPISAEPADFVNLNSHIRKIMVALNIPPSRYPHQ